MQQKQSHIESASRPSILSFIKGAAAASFSACLAESMTIPMDTVKVRLQMQNTKKTIVADPENLKVDKIGPKYQGLIGTTRMVIAEEGAQALWNGIAAGLHRQIIFSGLRVGLYEPVKKAICGDLPQGQNPALYQKAMAAIVTGAIGITVANPTDVVKVRLQNQGNPMKNTNKLPHYNGALDCYIKIIKHEGIKSLWTSWSANVVRNSIINCAELASYDQYKQMLLERELMRDDIPLHLTCAFGAGFTACIFGSPMDVLTTRHMNNPGVYRGPIDVAVQLIKSEGIFSLYKGFVPNVIRLGSFNMVLWLTFEQIKKRYL